MNKLRARISCEFPVEASSSRRDRRVRDPCGVSVPTVTHSLWVCATELPGGEPGVSSVSVTLPSTERPRRQRSQKRNCTHRTCMPTGCKFAELLARTRFSGIAIHFNSHCIYRYSVTGTTIKTMERVQSPLLCKQLA